MKKAQKRNQKTPPSEAVDTKTVLAYDCAVRDGEYGSVTTSIHEVGDGE